MIKDYIIAFSVPIFLIIYAIIAYKINNAEWFNKEDPPEPCFGRPKRLKRLFIILFLLFPLTAKAEQFTLRIDNIPTLQLNSTIQITLLKRETTPILNSDLYLAFELQNKYIKFFVYDKQSNYMYFTNLPVPFERNFSMQDQTKHILEIPAIVLGLFGGQWKVYTVLAEHNTQWNIISNIAASNTFNTSNTIEIHEIQ